eukprot:scaffold123204_cov33-Tisochrysis_lutea.AAC.4
MATPSWCNLPAMCLSSASSSAEPPANACGLEDVANWPSEDWQGIPSRSLDPARIRASSRFACNKSMSGSAGCSTPDSWLSVVTPLTSTENMQPFRRWASESRSVYKEVPWSPRNKCG